MTATLYHKVALRARAAAIDRICAGFFFAPFCAGIEHESHGPVRDAWPSTTRTRRD